jgi:hypothetical protein
VRLGFNNSGEIKMWLRQALATAALLIGAGAAHAEHFEFTVSLNGMFSEAGTDGCTPPFDQPTCPHAGHLSGLLSFDTPRSADGSYSIEDQFGDITDFFVNLGGLPYDTLYGGVNLTGGMPSGTVQSSDQTESFAFDWADRSASYVYDYGYHNINGAFSGSLSLVSESETPALMLLGILLIVRRLDRGALGKGRRNA